MVCEEVVNSTLAYSKMRTEWNYFSREEKQEKDKLRTILHNTFIVNSNVFHKLGEQLGLNGDRIKNFSHLKKENDGEIFQDI